MAVVPDVPTPPGNCAKLIEMLKIAKEIIKTKCFIRH
jgi:hypothetical protein